MPSAPKFPPPKPSTTLESLLQESFAPFQNKRILVVGDLMVDHYLWGNVDRTCYEAPVPVVLHQRDSWIPGAAANVAHNIAALGGRASLLGVVGCDEEGERLLALLRERGIGVTGVVRSKDRCTSIKTRVMSHGQQLLRIDRESAVELHAEARTKVFRQMAKLADRADAIIISDYAKGVVSRQLVGEVIRCARKRGVPVLVDPKGTDYAKYQGADLVKPNQRELALALGRPLQSKADILAGGQALMRRCGIRSLVVSRGAEGVAVIQSGHKAVIIPSRAQEVFDVSGAGDTMLAGLALSLASGLSLGDAAKLANHAAGVVVGKLGVATVSPQELLDALSGANGMAKIRSLEELQILLANLQAKGRKIVFTNGCFDILHPGHIHFLHQAKELGDVLVVGLNTDRSVRAVKGPSRPILPQNERAAILSALQIVDYIVLFDELTPENLLQKLRPEILAKGRNIPEDQVVGADLVRKYGGEVRRLPILRSSTASDIVDSILGKAGH